MVDKINYSILINEAMLSVIKNTLLILQRDNSVLDKHHFFITFATDNDKVLIPNSVKSKHPKRLTIVLQHQFENLTISDDGFSVVLFFDGVKEKIYVPFSAILHFSDPSVKFDLHFEFGYTLVKKIEKLINNSGGDIQKKRSNNPRNSKNNKVISLKDYLTKYDE